VNTQTDSLFVTYTIFWTQLEDDTWIALCDLFPSWKYKSDEQDKGGAEASLKRHASRYTRFVHMGWDLNT
jgi:hypothetical protein